MITYAEFFLFISLGIAIGYALHYKQEAHRMSQLFKLMLTNKDAREQILSDYENFKRREA